MIRARMMAVGGIAILKLRGYPLVVCIGDTISKYPLSPTIKQSHV
jgi:hypothetical protein